MSKFITFKPIGEILTEADLITKPQLEVALRDQIYNEDMLLGEILALRGWIKQDTADFFVREWFKDWVRELPQDQTTLPPTPALRLVARLKLAPTSGCR